MDEAIAAEDEVLKLADALVLSVAGSVGSGNEDARPGREGHKIAS